MGKRTENSGENLQVFENSSNFNWIIFCVIFCLEEQENDSPDALGHFSTNEPSSPICRAKHRRFRNSRPYWLIWQSDSSRYPHLFKRREKKTRSDELKHEQSSGDMERSGSKKTRERRSISKRRTLESRNLSLSHLRGKNTKRTVRRSLPSPLEWASSKSNTVRE